MIHNNNNSEIAFNAIPSVHTTAVSKWDLENECIRDMSSNGISFEGALKMDGELHRFSSDQKKNQPDEWYICHEGMSTKGNPYLVCTYGTWSGGFQKYSFKSYEKSHSFSLEELNKIKEDEKHRQQQADEQLQKLIEERIQQAQKAWEKASEEPISDACTVYLKNKVAGAYGVKFSKNKQGNDVLVIPIRNIEGALQAVQYIESSGEKRIHGLKKGNFHIIGEIADQSNIYIAEGYATAASVYQALGDPVVVAFDCGNLDSVIANLRDKFPSHTITITGDDDRTTASNPGRTKAEMVARKYNCQVVFPRFVLGIKLLNGEEPTDFNDLYVLSGPEEVKQQIQNFSIYVESNNANGNIALYDEWETPIELRESLPAVPLLNPLLLPEGLRQYAEDASDRMQCPIDFIAIPQLIMVSSLIGTGCAIRPKQLDNWSIIANLWGGIIGPPSIMKSPALSDALIPLGYLEKLADEDYKKRSLMHKIDQTEIKIRKGKIEGELKISINGEKYHQVEAHKTALAALEKEEKTIPWKRFKTNDATIEKLAEILQDNPRGILVYRDELTGFFVSLEKEGREGDRAFYLEGWNGYSSSPVTSDRIGRGTISCNPCISVLGGIQPSKLRRYLFATVNDISNDGFLQRFQLLVYPDAPKDFKLIDRKPNSKARDRVKEIAVTLAEIDFISMGAVIEENYPFPILRFNPEAQDFFNSWYGNLRKRLLAETEGGVFIEHLAKYPKLMPSLALNLHLISVADGQPSSTISLETAVKAVELCAYLEAHAKRIYAILEHKGILGAKALLKKLKSGDLSNGFTQRDVYKKGWSGLTGLKDAEEACDILVAKGWLKEETAPTTSKGGAPTIRYRIHPKVLKMAKTSTDTTDKTKED